VCGTSPRSRRAWQGSNRQVAETELASYLRIEECVPERGACADSTRLRVPNPPVSPEWPFPAATLPL
jgi:hypothetical protein